MISNDFGAILRQLREHADPALAGIPTATRRRTPGLRREELADLAGISADYLTRLERGRRRPSAGVVRALADALQLSAGDNERLYAAAGFATTGNRMLRELSPGGTRLLERLDQTPVCITDAAWSALGWNGAWTALHCGGASGQQWETNLAWRNFADTDTALVRTSEQATAFRTMITNQLHLAALRYPADETITAVVDELRHTTSDFDAMWRTGPGKTRDGDDQAVLAHPELGPIRLSCDVLGVPDGDLLALVVTAPPMSADSELLAELVRVGQSGPG